MDEGFERFAVRELPGLLRYAVLLTGDRELARDLVQDVMLNTHRRWPQIAAAGSPTAYVKRMLTNAHLSWRRRWAVRHVLVGLADSTAGPSTPDHADGVANRGALWQQLTTLPPRQRAVLVLRYYEGLTDPEIADVLGCSAGTVRGHASRALTSLRPRRNDTQHMQETQ